MNRETALDDRLEILYGATKPKSASRPLEHRGQGLYQPFTDAFRALPFVLDGCGHVALGHEVARELFRGERNLVSVGLPLEEPKPVLAALVVRESSPLRGGLG